MTGARKPGMMLATLSAAGDWESPWPGRLPAHLGNELAIAYVRGWEGEPGQRARSSRQMPEITPLIC